MPRSTGKEQKEKANSASNPSGAAAKSNSASGGDVVDSLSEDVEALRVQDAAYWKKKALQEAEARQEAEGKLKEEAEARQEAEGKLKEEAEARQEAEGKLKEEAEAHQQAEARLGRIVGVPKSLWETCKAGFTQVEDMSDLRSSTTKSKFRVDISELQFIDWPADLMRKLEKFAKRKEDAFSRIDVTYVQDLLSSEVFNLTSEAPLRMGLEKLLQLLHNVPGNYKATVTTDRSLADGAIYDGMDDEIPLLLLELKCRRLVRDGRTLLQELTEGMHKSAGEIDDSSSRQDAMDAMMQLLGYMQAASRTKSVRYGFLTTLNKFWAIFRLNDDTVWVSPQFNIHQTGYPSVLFVIIYVIHLAKTTRKSDTTLLKPLNPFKRSQVQDGTDDKRVPEEGPCGGNSGSSDGKRHGSSAGMDRSSALKYISACDRENIVNLSTPSTRKVLRKAAALKVGQVLKEWEPLCALATQQDRATFLVQSSQGLAIVKCFCDQEARDLEVICLAALGVLQGRCIPCLLASSCRSPLPDSRKRFAFMMSCVGGRPYHDYRDPKPLSFSALIQVLEVAREMHRLGVVHRDLQPRNVVVDASGHAFVVDFGSAMLKQHFRDEKRFDWECHREIAMLELQLAEAKTGGETSIDVQHADH